MALLERFKDYIRRENLIEKGESILLGVSGGPDSLTMLDLFCRIRDEYELDLLVFHLNHMFRQEAFAEAEYVKKVAAGYGLEIIVEEFNVPEYIIEHGYSPEEGARKARFHFLEKWAGEYEIKKIALAHNKDDLVETVFLNIFRGTGLKGLAGILPLAERKNFLIIHPLLDIYRQEIEEYCRNRDLNPCYDRTNEESIYTRNKLRNEIIPELEKEINPGLKGVVYRMALNIREEEAFLNRLGLVKFKECLLKREDERLVLSLEMLKREDKVIRRRIVQNAVRELKGNDLDLYTVHYQAIDDLILSGQTGRFITLPDKIQVRRSYENLFFEIRQQEVQEEGIGLLEIPGEAEWGDFHFKTGILPVTDKWKEMIGDKNVCFCDLKKIRGPLAIRKRKEGDFFYPFGLKGSKKLKDYLIDEKIPVEERDKIPIIVDNEDKIVWVAGYRVDGRFKIEEDTEEILKIEIHNTGGD
ncbi:MAG: tRNA lysidine(34) synthetase TilS [Halanaerobiaceae bacterium]|nr:tRNA lysidine(34) synthetase TilS [Halanaerobiaceae bacterium]